MQVDKERILALIGEIEKSLTVLEEYKKMEKDDLVSDLKSLGGVKYYFIISIEACIDICNHIVAKERFGVPDSYSSCFNILKENKVISRELSQKMVNMAKFRNLLVHLYWKIDDKKVYEFLQTELETFKIFTNIISKKYL